MHILIAGATGAAGRALIPHLIENGHTVTGTSRSAAKADEIKALGATPAVMDGLDADAVKRTVEAANPDVIVHQMTALSGLKLGKIDRQFEVTNRLRTEGTRNLIAAAPNALLIATSFAGWPYARTGGPVKTESDPLDPEPPKGIRETHAAIRTLEQLTVEARRHRPALRRVLRPRHRDGPRRRAGEDDPGAQAPDRRQRRGNLVDAACRGPRHRHARRDRARAAGRDLQRRRRRARGGQGVAAVPGRRSSAPSRPARSPRSWSA